MAFAPSTYSGLNESEYFQSQGGAVAEIERANQRAQENEFLPAVLQGRALARLAADRGLPFPLPVEWHKQGVRETAGVQAGTIRKMDVGTQYLLLKKALGLSDKTQAEVRRVLADYPKRWTAPKEAKDAFHQALGIESLVDLRSRVTDTAETASDVTSLAKLALNTFAPGVGALVLDRIAKAVKDGTKLTLELIDANKATSEVGYAKARNVHEASVNALRKRKEEEAAARKKQKEEEQKRATWWAYGTGAAVGLALVVWFIRGSRGGKS